jgi:putative ABC transport system substrate-binding protein
VRRRKFIALLGGAMADWPSSVRAQQPVMPVIGFLHTTSFDTNADRPRTFRQGLRETGYVEGEKLAIVYRFAENRNNRVPGVAADLFARRSP